MRHLEHIRHRQALYIHFDQRSILKRKACAILTVWRDRLDGIGQNDTKFSKIARQAKRQKNDHAPFRLRRLPRGSCGEHLLDGVMQRRQVFPAPADEKVVRVN